MFLFDWSKIYKASGGSSREAVRIFTMAVTREIPRNRYDPIYIYSQKSFSGNSYLLRPFLLIERSYKYTYKELADYIAAASFRSYANYKISRDTTLDRVLLPISDRRIDSFIENNRLLYLDSDRVHFLLEEVKS